MTNTMLSEEAMPLTLQEVYSAICQETIFMHDRWTMFRQLFVHEETIKLLGRTAESFFWHCHYSFLHETLLNICRLTDPAKDGKKENISLERLVAEAKVQASPTFKNEIEHLLSDAKSKSGFARLRRNKQLAHSDLATYRGMLYSPLEDVTREKVGLALGAIAQVINKVEEAYSRPLTAFGRQAIEGDANTLLEQLRHNVSSLVEGQSA